MPVVKELYRTNKNVLQVCSNLGIEYSEEVLEDLEACCHCNIWWHGYELIPDLDGNNICKFCELNYGL